jgi:hypothetical protein
VRARSCGRKRRTHVTRWLRYWARTVRPGVADPLGQQAFVVRGNGARWAKSAILHPGFFSPLRHL